MPRRASIVVVNTRPDTNAKVVVRNTTIIGIDQVGASPS
jgi:hypothetical protein